jgi:hypothetical protein
MSEPGQKYLRIDVPHHQDPKGVDVGSSFLRLGTAEPSPPMQALLEAIVDAGFIDDERDRAANQSSGSHATVEGAPGTAGMGHVLTPAQRKAETERLLSKGGWHDHTDGNRISTTQGDKVEVIRGNYKLVVLGRQATPNDPERELGNAAGWDVSGGHIQDSALAPNSIYEIKWVQTWDGTWKVVELCEKGDTHTIFHGNNKEEFYGDTLETITGGENPDDQVTLGKLVPPTKKKRPTITERTWATAIYSYTGSSGKEVPTITSETWATNIKDETTASSIETKVKGGPTIKEYVGELSSPAKTIDTATYAGAISERLHAGASSTVTNIGVASEVGTYGVLTQVEVFGAKAALITGVAMADLELSVLRLEVKAGVKFLEVEAGVLYTEVSLSNKLSFNFGKTFKLEKDKWETAANALSVQGKTDTLAIKLKKIALQTKFVSAKVGIGLEAD